MLNYKLISKTELKNFSLEIEKLNREIQAAKNFIQRIREDSRSAEYQGEFKEKGGLIHELLQMQEEIRKLAEQEQKQNWITEGLAIFSDILRQNFDNQRELGDRILEKLVHHLGANQAGFFLQQDSEEENYLELISCYAYNRKKYLKKKIRIEEDYAEGLIGQVFLEQKTQYLKDVPQDYLMISSGLGQVKPKHLIICPLLDQDESVGILEIASLQPFETYQIQFLEKLAERLASTILSTRINEHTKTLLISTKEQTEELLAQDEELRQNMEEMQATQEEVERVNQEINNTMDAINAANLCLELSPSGIIQKVNPLALAFFGHKEGAIEGKHHKLLLSREEADSKEYQEFWETLRNGESISGVFMRKNRDGETKWLRATYFPIKNLQGKVLKILKIASDCTLEKEQEIQIQNKQRLIEQNRVLLKERTKAVQDKAYKRIKTLKSELNQKDLKIQALEEQLNTLSNA